MGDISKNPETWATEKNSELKQGWVAVGTFESVQVNSEDSEKLVICCVLISAVGKESCIRNVSIDLLEPIP